MQKRRSDFVSRDQSYNTMGVKFETSGAYNPEGCLIGSFRNREMICGGRAALERAISQGLILEGIATLCDGDMNLHVDLHGIKGIIPKEEICFLRSDEKIKDIAIITRVGKPVCFKVISIEERDGETYAVLSRRLAQIDCINNYIATLIPGDIVNSRVTHLDSFGAFVDIGCGVISLLTIDCMSVSRFSHPKDRLYCGMFMPTVIKSIDRESGRIFVTMRELLGTWEENAARFSAGQTVAGIVRSVEKYGIFVELAPNLAGLAEVKDNSAEIYERGSRAAVYIKSIIPERMKIKLVLIDYFKDDTKTNPNLHYYIDFEKTKHIDHWRYSPEQCQKVIETVF